MEIYCLIALPGIFFFWVTTKHVAMVLANALPTYGSVLVQICYDDVPLGL